MQEVEQDKMKLSKTTSYFYALAILANLSLWFKICSDTRWLSGHTHNHHHPLHRPIVIP